MASQFESFDQAVLAANTWIHQYSVRVVNFETLVLPNVWNTASKSTLESKMNAPADTTVHWYQVLRVWFEVPDSAPG